MATETIIEFLRTGELTNFPFGTGWKTIISTLGDNPGWTVMLSRKDKRPAIIKYDQTEFYFNEQVNQELYGVLVTYSQPADKKGLDMDYDSLKRNLNYRQVIDFLTRHHISFEERFSEYDTNDKVIKTIGQVIFYFSDDKKLQKFGRFLT
jgi:hypothetical protein